MPVGEEMHDVLTLLAPILVCWLVVFFSGRRRYRLPPGPRGFPLIGNILDAPKENSHLVFQEWGRRFSSDVLYFEILGARYVVLNSRKAMMDLLERRSNVYADKPETIMLNLTGWNRDMGMLKYGDFWRRHRKMFHQYFRADAVPAYHPRTTQAVLQMLHSLYISPERWLDHIHFLTASNVLGLMYGKEVKPEGDPFLELLEKGLEIFSIAANPGVYLVDSFPTLRFLPMWFPGARFKRDAAKWKLVVDEVFLRPYRELKAAFNAGSPPSCVATQIFTELHKDEAGAIDPMLEDVVVGVTGTAYAGEIPRSSQDILQLEGDNAADTAAADTTSAVMATFVLAMLFFPEAQQEAQEEIDRVIGEDRLPGMEDRSSLPYITALVREILRWRPPSPSGIIHQPMRDDEYEGYHIPTGSVVIGNVWAILHDEKQYLEPETFNPARFLDSKGQLLEDTPDVLEVFGFGRRKCPGRYFAADVIWLAIVDILAAFSIEKPIDELGDVLEPTGEYTSGLTSRPLPFKATFKPRSSVLFNA